MQAPPLLQVLLFKLYYKKSSEPKKSLVYLRRTPFCPAPIELRLAPNWCGIVARKTTSQPLGLAKLEAVRTSNCMSPVGIIHHAVYLYYHYILRSTLQKVKLFLTNPLSPVRNLCFWSYIPGFLVVYTLKNGHSGSNTDKF